MLFSLQQGQFGRGRNGAGGGGTPTYRYWRVYIEANSGDVSGPYSSMAKVELLDGSTDRAFGLDLSSYTASTTLTSGVEAYQVGDNDAASRWISSAGGAAPSWLAIALTAQFPITSYAISAPNQASTQDRTPSQWRLQANNVSAGSGETWIDIDLVSGQTGWGSGERRVFSTT